MAKGNGNKDPIEQVVEELRGMRAEFTSELRETRAEFKSGLRDLRVEMTTRLDRVIENTGGHYRRLEERIAALEAKVH